VPDSTSTEFAGWRRQARSDLSPGASSIPQDPLFAAFSSETLLRESVLRRCGDRPTEPRAEVAGRPINDGLTRLAGGLIRKQIFPHSLMSTGLG